MRYEVVPLGPIESCFGPSFGERHETCLCDTINKGGSYRCLASKASRSSRAMVHGTIDTYWAGVSCEKQVSIPREKGNLDFRRMGTSALRPPKQTMITWYGHHYPLIVHIRSPAHLETIKSGTQSGWANRKCQVDNLWPNVDPMSTHFGPQLCSKIAHTLVPFKGKTSILTKR